MNLRITIAVAAVCLATAPSAAPIPEGYSSFVVAGDSLSDPGNVYRLTSETPGLDPTPPSPPYFAGRFSNGPVWADLIGADFAAASKAVLNVAFGGARVETDTSTPVAFLIPDLDQQIALIAAQRNALGPRPLGAVFMGGNDLLGLLDEDDVEDRAREIAGDLVDRLGLLADLQIRDLVTFTQVDLGRTPRTIASGTAAIATQVSATFNDALRTALGEFDRPGVQIDLVEIDLLYDDLFADPESFGVSELLMPCLIPGSVLPVCDDPNERAFFDPLHPSAPIHAAIASAFRAEVDPRPVGQPAPVPLPASLPLAFGAVAIFGFLARRQPGRRR